MEKETISLNQKEQQRVMVLNRVERGELTGNEAAGLMGLCVRQVRRLLAAYRKEGIAAIAHGNRGHRPAHAVGKAVRKRVVELAQGPYAGCNHSHLTELLGEREALHLSRSTVRRILVAAGLPSPKRRRPPQHRCRRERYPQEGMLLQVDGSRHDWLEGRGSPFTLVAAIDDATGTVPAALFREQEDAHGYFLLLQEVLRCQGVPLALYSDRHGIFQRSPQEKETLEEQLSGDRQPTQFGRALHELGIQPIFARSPQAKGRIERLFGTFQDRLVTELRLAGATTAEEAHRVLVDFLPRFNARVGVPAAQEGSAYRPLSPSMDLAGVLCFTYQRTVAKDNTVRFGGHTLQLLPGPDRLSYAQARVEVQERLDGSLVVAYQGQVLAIRKAPSHPVVLRARKGARSQPPAPANRSVGVSAPGDQGTQGQGAGERGPDPAGAHRQADVHTNGQKPSPDHPWKRFPVVTKSLNH